MDFVIGLPISADWKGDSYNSILVIIDRLTKIVYNKPVKVMINTLGLTEVIINMVVHYHGVSESIVMNRDSIFTLKFWSLLCYFLDSRRNYLQSSIFKQKARPRDKTAR